MRVHLIKLLCLRLAVSAWLGSIGAAAYAQVDCNVINKLALVHTAQMRFYTNDQAPFAAAELAIIGHPSLHLGGADLLRAIRGHPVAVNAPDFVQFAANTNLLTTTVNGANTAEIRNHFADDEVARNLSVIGGYIGQLQCQQQAGGGSGFGYVAPASSGSDIGDNIAPPKTNPSYWNIVITILVAAAAYQTVKTFRAFARRKKRRAKRYPTNLQTEYKIDGKVFTGRLMDISGKGSKLRHDPDGAPLPTSEMKLRLFGNWHDASVAWANPHYSGLMFKKPLRYEKVRRIHKWHEKQPVAA